MTIHLEGYKANLCFHFTGSGENLPDIAKSRDSRMDNKKFSSFLQILMKQNSFLFQTTSCHFSVEVFLQITHQGLLCCVVAEGNSRRESQVSLD